MTKRVLIWSPYGTNSGGINRWTEHIMAYYLNNNINNICLDVLPMNRTWESINASTFIGRIYNGMRDYYKMFLNLKTKLKDDNYKILHIASSASVGLYKDWASIKFAHKKNVKAIVHFHFGRIPDLANKNNWEWKMLKRVIRIADAAIVLDSQSYNVLRNVFPKKKIYKIPNPIGNDLFDMINKYSSNDRNQRVILYAGHLHREKGIFELVAACKDITNIQLRLVGEYSESIKTELEKFQDTVPIEITGNKTLHDVINEMCRCAIFVLPSYTEGFPNVILESMACGCPIIATTVGAIPEMLAADESGEYGLLIKPYDISDLKSKIETLLNDPIRRKNMGENAHKRVCEKYSLPSIFNDLVSIWQNIN